MKILDKKSTVLLNSEVYEVLKDRGGLNKDRFSRALPVEKHAAEYLNQVCSVFGHDDDANVGCKEALSKLPLGSSEVFQILNLRPRTVVEVFLIVEDLEERLGDDADSTVDKIVSLVQTHYPQTQPTPPD
eukprot:jgi/Ulvmu1/11984/UM082_0063.1